MRYLVLLAQSAVVLSVAGLLLIAHQDTGGSNEDFNPGAALLLGFVAAYGATVLWGALFSRRRRKIPALKYSDGLDCSPLIARPDKQNPAQISNIARKRLR